jgi:hypothetical protein
MADDLASEWRSFDDAKRQRLLSKMTPDQKKKLRSTLEGQSTPPPQDAATAKSGFLDTLKSNFESNIQPQDSHTFGGAMHNFGAGAAKLFAGIPGFAADVLDTAGDVATGKTRPEELINMLDPGNMVQGVKDQFEEDYKHDKAYAVENLLGTVAGGLVAQRAGQGALEGLGKGAGAAKNAIRPNAVREFAQATMEAGKPFAERTVEKFGKESQDVREANQGATETTLEKRGKVDEANKQASEKHSQDVEATREKNKQSTASTLEKRAKVDEQNRRLQEQHEEALAAARERNKNAEAKTLEKRGKVEQTNAGKIKRDMKARQAIDEQNRQALAEHHQNVAEIQSQNAEAQGHLDRRAAIQQQLAEEAPKLDTKYAQAEAKAKGENDAAWNAWRKKVANTDVDMEPVVSTIKAQADKMSPDEVSEFRSILKETKPTQEDMTGDERERDELSQAQYKKPWDKLTDREKSSLQNVIESMNLQDMSEENTLAKVPASRLHGWKTQLESAVRRAKNGNVRFAIGQVLDSVRAREDQVSAEAGAQDELKAARALHGPYVETFRNSPNEPPTVASKSLSEEVPEYVKERNRNERVGQVSRYDPSIKEDVERIRGLHEELGNLPSESTARARIKDIPEAPAPKPYGEPSEPTSYGEPEPVEPLPERPAAASYGEPEPVAPLPERPTPKQYGEPEATKPLPNAPDLTAARREQIGRKLEGYKRLSPWEIRILAAAAPEAVISMLTGHERLGAVGSGLLIGEIGKQILVRVLERPSVMDWLSKPTPDDIEAINQLPPADAARMKSVLTDMAKRETSKTGRKAKIDPRIASWLGVAANKPQNRKEALESLR